MVFLGDGSGNAVRLVPRVHRQGVFVVVNGEHLTRLQVGYCLFQSFRRGVDIPPVVVVLTVFQKGQIHCAEPFADLFEPLVVSAVAAYIDFASAGFCHKRRPERLVASAQQPVAEMAGRQTGNPNRRMGGLEDLHILVPVRFDDLRVRVLPVAQIVGDAERTDDLLNTRAQVAERGVIHVVPVLVGDDENIYIRHILRTVDIRAGERLEHERCRELGLEYRVHYKTLAAQGEQVRRVPEPYHPVFLRRKRLEVSLAGFESFLRSTQRVCGGQETPDRFQRTFIALLTRELRCRFLVLKHPLAVVG